MSIDTTHLNSKLSVAVRQINGVAPNAREVLSGAGDILVAYDPDELLDCPLAIAVNYDYAWLARDEALELRDKLNELFSDAPAEPDEPQDIKALLVKAIADAHYVEFDYTDAHGNDSHRVVDPIRLERPRGRAQEILTAIDVDADEPRCFRVDRIGAFSDVG